MTTAPHPLFVVGIGASAGGLNALERFFDNLPRETGMAFVVVQHLSPDFKSLMDELLARHTEMPIHPVEDGMRVEPNNVYLIPPKKEMIISDGRLLLSDRERQQELTLPIDVFFRSLAQDCGARAVAIVLSGGGTDGSRGIRDIHAAGGVVMVQDVASAQFDGMPKTARDVGVAQWILAPDEMPQALLDHAEQTRVQRLAHPEGPLPAAETTEARGLEAVYRMLQDEFGLDFTHYKPSTVTRRIERRLALARSNDIDEYVQRLRGEREELDVLYRDLLIGVTRFFRDQEAFDILEERVLPELLQRQPREEQLRIWVAGCATGEEVYSLAIVLRELMLKLGERSVQIFASDVHRGSIDRASRAIYDADAVINVSKERLARYFVRMGDAYQVVPDLRQMVVFAQHNVIKDAPFTRVDLVSCRNLLIYLQPAVQQKVLSLFRFALRRGGVLFLGPSETVGLIARDFETIDKHWRLYRKHTDVRTPVDVRPSPLPLVPAEVRAPLHLGATATTAPGARYSLTHLLGTYDTLLEEMMPPSLLVTDRGELVHAFGGASRFLRPRDGRQDLDVLDVVDRDLKMVLVGGLKRALNEPSAIVFRGVRIGGATAVGDGGQENGREKMYTVTLRRVRNRTGGAPHLLISFEEVEGHKPPAAPAVPPTEIALDQIPRDQLRALESELSHTKENLQAAIEELETSNEELQASNEELQASNEELQSTNEELQSVNEELYTVNAEYQRKIGELTELANDMDNLLASTEVGAVFLDRQLKIRKFTPQIAETFSLLPHDVGRPIETFTYKMDHPELVDDLKQVLATGEPIERELRGVRGKVFFLRVLPYRAKGSVDGVVLTLIDVDGLKKAEDALFHERYLLNSFISTVPDALYFKDASGRFIRANQAMAQRLGLEDATAVEGKTVFELGNDRQAAAWHAQDEAVLRTGQAQHYSLEKRPRAEGRPEWDLVTRLPLRDQAGGIVGVTVIFRNVTEQKNAEEDIREAVRRRDQFLAMLSHELRNPLGAIVTATALLKVDSTGVADGGASEAAGRRKGRLLAILERQSQQMTRLLDDLLEASRVTQNKVELKKESLDLNVVVKDASDAVRGQVDAHGLALTVEPSAPPLTVEGDPARLQQILVNLLSNAIKYTPRDGHVSLRVTREGEQAVLRVKDDGVGIRPDMLHSVFDLFVQSRSTLDRAAGGLGVGLTLVRSLTAMHGGTVTAHSEGDGKGSEFVLRLPLGSQPTPSLPSDGGGTEDAPHICAVSPGATIVVVEDNADSREMLCELLELSGFKCRTASDGKTALKLIEEVHPEIAILDVGLPEMDGFELARRLRLSRKSGDLCLIALTGYGQPSDRALSAEAGFDAHLVKPIQAEQLLGLLDTLRAPPSAPGPPPDEARALETT
ncbi:MAG TPA: chemotaxis protein CheB [Polyangia bacterium]|jgi:two-component system CheB/CheR fusion protein